MNPMDLLPMPTRWRQVHRASAVLVGGFAVMHMAHHLVGLAGIDAHLAAARVLRLIYRHAWLEPVLLAAVALQWLTGTVMATRRLSARGQRLHPQAWLQCGSGLVLSMFIPIHVLSVLWGRGQGLDTNFYFAAAGLHDASTAPFFVPYYGLAVVALFLHLGLAFGRPLMGRSWPATLVAGAVGGVCAALLVLLLAGRIHPFTVPPSHRGAIALSSS